MTKRSPIKNSWVGNDLHVYHRHADGAISQLLPREKDIQKSILEFLELRRIFAYRQNSGAFVDKAKHFYRFASMNGLPDIVAVIRGKYIGIEVKKPGGKLRDAQKELSEALTNAGGIYWVFDSLDEAVDTIESYIKSND